MIAEIGLRGFRNDSSWLYPLNKNMSIQQLEALLPTVEEMIEQGLDENNEE